MTDQNRPALAPEGLEPGARTTYLVGAQKKRRNRCPQGLTGQGEVTRFRALHDRR